MPSTTACSAALWLTVVFAGQAPPPDAPKQPAAQQDTPDVEGLRERVTQFHVALRDAKFRGALAFVADDSQDLFMASGRITIGEFTVQSLRFDKERGFATATVEVLTEMGLVGRRVPSRVPQESYWKRADGVWMWFVPEIVERKTPFGVVKVPRHDLAAASKATREELQKRLKEAPTVASILESVAVNVTDVTLSRSKDSQAEFTVVNSMPGWVTVEASLLNLPGVTIEPARMDVASGATLTLRVSRPAGPGDAASGIGTVAVSPLGLRRTFRVQLVD